MIWIPRELYAFVQEENRCATTPQEAVAMFDDKEGRSLDELAVRLASAYSQCRQPLRAVPRKQWVALFRQVGYVRDAMRRPNSRPETPITLYRGCDRRYRRGLSWTPYLPAARRYGQPEPGCDKTVYTITAEPGWLLGEFNGITRARELLADVPKGVVERID